MARQPILDVRPEPDFLIWHVPGSVNIPLAELPRRMYELPEKGQAIEVYDEDPVRALLAIELLTERGYIVTAAEEQETFETGPSLARLWSPSPLVEEAAGLIAPGRALDLACGSGRDAVWLASRGWQVTAIDVLADALANARDLAARNGVKVDLLEQDLIREPSLDRGEFDLITIIRFWHEPLAARAANALQRGGLLVIEAFHPGDAADDTSRNASRLITPERIAASVPELTALVQRVVERAGRKYSQVIARR